MDTETRKESGQSFVLLVLGMVAMLGFAALAIDGGMLYTERRQAQNAADTAALAAVLAKINGQDWHLAGMNAAQKNGYDNNGTTNTVTVHNPPVSGNYAGNSEYVQVFIDTTLNTAFAHFIFQGPLKLTVEAIARAKPEGPLLSGNALVALSPDACAAMDFNGTQTTTIIGGGVFSNSTANGSPPSCAAGVQNGSGDVTVTDGDISVVGTFRQVGSGSVSPTPQEGASQITTPVVPTPDCSSLPNMGSVTTGGTISPGNYTQIRVSGNDDLTMNPGLYCLSGDFKVTGGSLVGNGVTIYLISGDFDTSGNTDITLSAPQTGGSGVPPAIVGMLIYMDPNNAGEIKLTGNTGSTYTGTVFAPAGEVEVGGSTGTLGLGCQIIGDTVKVFGNASLTITFNASDNYRVPPKVELTK